MAPFIYVGCMNDATPLPLYTCDPEILDGTPVFTGTRVPVRTMFDYLIGGHSLDAFIDDFPSVERGYAARVLREGAERVLNRSIEKPRETPNDIFEYLGLSSSEFAVLDAHGTLAVDALVTQLKQVFRESADARNCLDVANAALGNRTARELIRTGEFDEVTRVLYAVNAGIPF